MLLASNLSLNREGKFIFQDIDKLKGVGNKLVDAMIADADSYYKSLGEKIRKLYLLTHEENKLAHKFYEKVGFKHETTLSDHYYKDVNERVYSIFFNV